MDITLLKGISVTYDPDYDGLMFECFDEVGDKFKVSVNENLDGSVCIYIMDYNIELCQTEDGLYTISSSIEPIVNDCIDIYRVITRKDENDN
jgi:hypothetical protein